MVVKKTRIIVVVNEDTKCVDVCEERCLCIILRLDVSHVGPIAEDVVDGEIHRVVEECRDTTLILSNIGWVYIETFTHLENA